MPQPRDEERDRLEEADERAADEEAASTRNPRRETLRDRRLNAPPSRSSTSSRTK